MRLIQISDTHLSAGKRHFADNWAPLADWIAAQRPDLVVHTGDVTVDGAGVEADLAHCAALLRDLRVPLRVIPGNHDVGDGGNLYQPVTEARLARWRAHFGSDRWVEDVEGWRLIGGNALLPGSGLADETEQEAWLDTVMTAAGGRRLAWFIHKPLFLDDPEEGDTGYWTIKPAPRRAWLDRVRRHAVALVASGHLHRAHRREMGGTSYIWGPSSAFLVGPSMPAPPMPGDNRLGAVVYELDGAAMTADIVEVPGLQTFWIDDVVDEVYPRHS